MVTFVHVEQYLILTNLLRIHTPDCRMRCFTFLKFRRTAVATSHTGTPWSPLCRDCEWASTCMYICRYALIRHVTIICRNHVGYNRTSPLLLYMYVIQHVSPCTGTYPVWHGSPLSPDCWACPRRASVNPPSSELRTSSPLSSYSSVSIGYTGNCTAQAPP